MKITVPELSLIILVGPSGSGKSTFAKKYFKPTEVVSSDFCRALVSDDENSNEATQDAFDLLNYILAKRLKRGQLTVIDATNVQAASRKKLLQIAKEYHVLSAAIVFKLPLAVCEERNETRTDRDLPRGVIKKHMSEMKRSLRGLKREGFRFIYNIESEEDANSVSIERARLWSNLSKETGPFDIIGDIHGCFDELQELIQELGYEVTGDFNTKYSITHPDSRRLIFLGDLVDRGPKTPEVIRFVKDTVEKGQAFCVVGNHDSKLNKLLKGKDVRLTHGLAESKAQLDECSDDFRKEVQGFLDGLISHYVLDNGRLVVSHAGLREEMHGRASGAIRSFCMYGETTGEVDEYGLPVRFDWAREYRGRPIVVYGHTPIPEAEWVNKTINIDTGCVFGGKLTALRYPEKELVSVPARKVYYEPAKPLVEAKPDRPYRDLLSIEDIAGKRIVNTRLRPNITIQEEQSAAAIEALSRFAINPKWLVYLPPTMSPSATSSYESYLEYPTEAFQYYKKRGVSQVVCEEKHMGSRAVVIVCKDAAAAQGAFGVDSDEIGICYTRTGRRFFNDLDLEKEFLQRVADSLSKAGFWDEFETSWFCLDTELMPWSFKAQSLLTSQYAAVGAAAKNALGKATAVLEQVQTRGIETGDLLQRLLLSQKNAAKFTEAYREYCWPINSLEDIRLAPFHILASEGATYASKDHGWHMEQIDRLVRADEGLYKRTGHRVVNLSDDASVQSACEWWESMVASGGEGMVVKPFDFIAEHKSELLQPAVKCRGPEYLRIIYGPDYDLPENLVRLRERGLSKKRSLALREFSLGLEAIERFVAKEPLYRVHECVAAVMALESDPIDPRL